MLSKETEDLNSGSKLLVEDEFRSYKYRYAIVGIFCLMKICSGMVGPTFSSVQQDVKQIYGVTDFDMNLLSLVFFLSFIPTVFLASWVLIGGTLLTAGSWLRLLVATGDSSSYYFMIVFGQTVAALGSPFLLSAPSKLAAYWFPDNERVFATTLGSSSFELGVIVSYTLPLLFISEQDKTNGKGKEHVFLYLLVQSIIITIPTVLAFAFFRNRPPTPPSPAAVVLRPSMAQSLPALVKNCNYLVLAASFTFFWSSALVLGVVLSQVTSKFGYKSSDNSVMGAAFILFGVTGAIFYSKIVDKGKNFKRAISIFIVTCIVCQEGAGWLYYTKILAPPLILISILGFHLVACLPLYLEFGCEIAYPVGQDSIVAFLMLPVNCFSIGLTYLCTFLTQNFDEGYPATQALAGSVVLSLILILFVKEDLRRKNAEKKIRLTLIEERSKNPSESNPTIIFESAKHQ